MWGGIANWGAKRRAVETLILGSSKTFSEPDCKSLEEPSKDVIDLTEYERNQ